MNINIRQAVKEDVPFINEIINYAILNTNYNLNTIIRTIDDTTKWFETREADDHPIIVATYNNKPIGWSSLSHFRYISGYSTTAEVSVYVHHELQGKGIGKILLNELEAQARFRHYHCLMAVITEQNIPSLKLHISSGFKVNCILNEIAYKNDNYINVAFLNKILN